MEADARYALMRGGSRSPRSHASSAARENRHSSPIVRAGRSPRAIYSDAGLRAARADRLRPLLWSKWGKDWRKFTTPERIAARATGEIAAGDVILLHDADFYSSRNSHRRTAAALSMVIAELERRELGTVLPV